MALRSFSTAKLRQELARREKGAGRLQKQHNKLAAQLKEIELELADLGVDAGARRGRHPGHPARRRGPGRPPGRRGPGRPPKASRRKRAKNDMSLHEALARVVRVGSTVAPADAATAVKRIYKSASKTFGIQVATTLAKSPLFKKIGRAAYLRRAGTAASLKRGPKRKLRRRADRKTAKSGRRTAGRTRSLARKPAAVKPVSAAPAAAS